MNLADELLYVMEGSRSSGSVSAAGDPRRTPHVWLQQVRTEGGVDFQENRWRRRGERVPAALPKAHPPPARRARAKQARGTGLHPEASRKNTLEC